MIHLARRVGGCGGVLLGVLASGCFGDWVSARPRPGPEASTPVAAAVDLGVPTDACAAYRAAVAERCDAVLDGHLGHCHREIVRVMTLWREDEGDPASGAPAGAGQPHGPPEPEQCAQQQRALPEPPRRAAAPALGPECRAWAEAIRERCVAPLSSPTPDLRGCGPDLLAFESVVGASTFGRPLDHEPTCRDAVRRMRAQ